MDTLQTEKYLKLSDVVGICDKLDIIARGVDGDYAHGGFILNAVLATTEAVRHETNTLPAADVVPVRYSSWVRSEDGYMRCRLCGSRASAIKARYCHHCGALMDKDGDGNA